MNKLKLKHATLSFKVNAPYFKTFDGIFKAAQWVREREVPPIMKGFPNLTFAGIDNHFGHDHQIFWVPNN